MKSTTLFATCVLAASTLAVVPVRARPMHAGINYQRYLAEIDNIKAETDEWMATFGKMCEENNWLPEYSSEERGAIDKDEDMRQRIFMSKQDVLKAQAANPNANFSIMTPFSALTKDEFASKVLNSHVRANRTGATPTPLTAAPKRSLRQQNGYSFTSMQDMIDTLMASLQEQMGGSWSSGTVMPVNDDIANEADPSGSYEWHWSTYDSSPTDAPTDASIPETQAPTPATQAPTSATDAPETYAPRTQAPIPATDAPETYAPRTQAPTPVYDAPKTYAPSTRTPVAEPVTKRPSTPAQTEKASASTANSIDWSASKCMSPIQSQGQCGSCWAFASVAAVESLQCIKGGQKGLNKYSEQQLVGCNTQNGGCGGGVPIYAFDYIEQNGLCSESEYPYTLSNGGGVSCSTSCSKSQTGITGYEQLDDGDEAGLVKTLKSQPVVVTVASGNAEWKQYTGGVLSSCGTTDLDHVVLVVGYDDSTFKVRNSWGENWGEAGYVRMDRSSSGTGTCGMLTGMSYPKM